MGPTSLIVHPAASVAGGIEEIRRAASVIPGYGPPDISYPSVFRGRWTVACTIADVKTPLGEDAAPGADLRAARAQMESGQSLAFEARYIEYDAGTTIADRSFNAERRAAAPPGAPPLQELEARWEPNNPNVLTLATRSSGSVVETKVTKRSVEVPFDGALGTSEYARIADAGSSGVLGGVPSISAVRVQTRYKWDVGDGASPRPQRIEALELRETFDPTATGFADLAGATPVLRVKSRLVFSRQS